ncbi:MAG: hypothetical protein V3W33_01930 [Gammaproteobacteria bacterium]|jgi:hypothetical protein
MKRELGGRASEDAAVLASEACHLRSLPVFDGRLVESAIEDV